MVDFQTEGKIGLSWGLYDSSAQNGLVADIDYSGNYKRTFTYFATPKQTSKAKILFAATIDDVSDKAVFDKFHLHIYQRSNVQAVPLVQHLPL